jgi:predicted RNA polymerase sigma factor
MDNVLFLISLITLAEDRLKSFARFEQKGDSISLVTVFRSKWIVRMLIMTVSWIF